MVKSIVTYIISCFLLPVGICDKIEKTIRQVLVEEKKKERMKDKYIGLAGTNYITQSKKEILDFDNVPSLAFLCLQSNVSILCRAQIHCFTI